MESLQIGVATHFQMTLLFLMRTDLPASLQSCRSIDADAWCKRALIRLIKKHQKEVVLYL